MCSVCHEWFFIRFNLGFVVVTSCGNYARLGLEDSLPLRTPSMPSPQEPANTSFWIHGTTIIHRFQSLHCQRRTTEWKTSFSYVLVLKHIRPQCMRSDCCGAGGRHRCRPAAGKTVREAEKCLSGTVHPVAPMPRAVMRPGTNVEHSLLAFQSSVPGCPLPQTMAPLGAPSNRSSFQTRCLPGCWQQSWTVCLVGYLFTCHNLIFYILHQKKKQVFY